ncbi:hypothetical protein VIBNISFn118_640054 [Vibrio nigripulchritudo SFn118]|nr:hypothetical protein VIBNISFn118_640054 [Vibrio nigripulchritudo SFn118]
MSWLSKTVIHVIDVFASNIDWFVILSHNYNLRYIASQGTNSFCGKNKLQNLNYVLQNPAPNPPSTPKQKVVSNCPI